MLKAVSVDLRISRIYRHLAASPSFGGQIAEAWRASDTEVTVH